jgi:hypothetical protein
LLHKPPQKDTHDDEDDQIDQKLYHFDLLFALALALTPRRL